MLTNRTNPPDAILREVYLRTGDKPFRRIDDVISHDELAALSERYQRVAGFDKETLQAAGKAEPATAETLRLKWQRSVLQPVSEFQAAASTVAPEAEAPATPPASPTNPRETRPTNRNSRKHIRSPERRTGRRRFSRPAANDQTMPSGKG